MDADEYQKYDGLGLGELVRRGEVSAAELLQAARDRTAAVNPQINAVVRMLDAHADARVREHLSGPFAGVPFLVKDLFQAIAGVPESAGCRALERRPVRHTATVVQRWIDAGTVVFGRTNTPEFGAKGVTEPELFGPTRNPWDLSRTPGGSSGGSAAAVAAGIVPVAGANDGGGSIRIPAACCGLFGLKPGRGVVPMGPEASEEFHGAAVQGVLSRSVRDTAAMLDVLAGPDPAPPYVTARPTSTYLAELERPPGRLRIGVQVASSLAPSPHPEAVAAIAATTSLLGDLGHHVEEAPIGHDDEQLAQDFLLPWFAQVAAMVEEAGGDDGHGFELDTRVMAAIGRSTSAARLTTVLRRWHRYVERLSDYHRRYDLLLTPTLAVPPVRVGELATPAVERFGARLALALRVGGMLLPRIGVVRSAVRRNLSWVPYTQLANLTGRPAMSVPLHTTADGLPFGVQFVAPPGGEGLLLRLAAQVEQARPWADRRPPL